ncbi:MAG: hypothetical protein NTU85_03190 [Candidatus Kaiserbacteria bacterium]|nr:hypothetical protein [Candidatus Kaiserbacteria bacterium]
MLKFLKGKFAGKEQQCAKNPTIIALIGIAGSGKSSVAQALSKHIHHAHAHAVVICADKIYAFNQESDVIIVDSDLVDTKKRASLNKEAKKIGASIVFIYVSCDVGVMVGRIVDTIRRTNCTSDSEWKRKKMEAITKLQEMLHLLPKHYRLVSGHWEKKDPPCAVLANIDTTDSSSWEKEVEEVCREIKINKM